MSLIKQISCKEAKALLEDRAVLMIDVRRSDERESSYIPGTLWITLGELSEEKLIAKGIKKNSHVILQCRSGGRSQTAAEAMLQWGFTNLSNLDGGILDWIESGYTVNSK